MVTSQLVASLGSNVIALFGGGSVILIAICGFVSKYVADHSNEKHKSSLNIEIERVKSVLGREAEEHKLQLKKAELLFDRQLGAVAEFSALYHKIRPDYSRPDMDWDDACEVVAGRFVSIEVDLEAYLIKHGPILNEAIRSELQKGVGEAASHKFETYGAPGDVYDAKTRAAAGNLLKALGSIENKLFELVRTEGGTLP